MNEEPNHDFPPTAEEAEQLGEPYIPWHAYELDSERKAAWLAMQREKQLAAFRERRAKRMMKLGMKPSDASKSD